MGVGSICERRARLDRAFNSMSIAGQDVVLNFACAMELRFPAPTAQIIPFTREKPLRRIRRQSE